MINKINKEEKKEKQKQNMKKKYKYLINFGKIIIKI